MMAAAAQQEKQFSILPAIFLSFFSRASKGHLFVDSAKRCLAQIVNITSLAVEMWLIAQMKAYYMLMKNWALICGLGHL